MNHSDATAVSLAELLRSFQAEADALRSDLDPPGGAIEVALNLVAEALDIGATITASAQQSQDHEMSDGCVHIKVTTAATDIDYHHLERRTRALRTALNGVDDYVWWGGLATAS